MSIPRNTPANAGAAATPDPRLLRRRAVMVANLVASSGLFFFAACSESGLTGPAAAARPGDPAYGVSTSIVTTTSSSGGSTSTTTNATSTSTNGDTARVTLTISPTTNATFQVNTHKVQIVPGSVCDPKTSGYGPGSWNVPCTPAKSTVTVTAKSWTTKDGHPMVAFSPDIRFVPGKVNTIWLLDTKAASAKLDPLTWCPGNGAACVNEGATDGDLVTKYTSDGYASRRLKHFSGYTVGYARY